MSLIIVNNINGIPIVPSGSSDFVPGGSGVYIAQEPVPSKDPLLSNKMNLDVPLTD